MIKDKIKNKVNSICNDEPWAIIGIRLEDYDREAGSPIIQNSRHNPDREDPRDFPDYTSPKNWQATR